MNRLLLALEVPSDIARSANCPEQAKYSDELDSIVSVFYDLCNMLAEVPDIRFVVHGFDEHDWRVDVQTDLAVVLEQVPQVLKDLGAGRAADLDFFEQGIERALRLEGTGAELAVTCSSRHVSWRPNPETIQVPRVMVVGMLRALAETFYQAAARVCPVLVQHPWIISWLSDVRKNSQRA